MGTLVITSRSEEPFMDRYEAGMALGNRLLNSADESTVVLGIPRGGVIVARGIARILGADLDIVLTRRMGAPDNPELTIGALSEDGQLFLDAGLSMRAGVDEAYIEQEKAYQMSVILQMAGRYRKVRPKIPLEGRTVVITDEGAADGSTLQASLWAVRKEPRKADRGGAGGKHRRIDGPGRRCRRNHRTQGPPCPPLCRPFLCPLREDNRRGGSGGTENECPGVCIMEDTTRMTDAVDLGHKLGYVLLATADASGFPNLAVANVIKRVSEDKLAISSWFCPATVANLRRNPRLDVIVWDSDTDQGYQILGTA